MFAGGYYGKSEIQVENPGFLPYSEHSVPARQMYVRRLLRFWTIRRNLKMEMEHENIRLPQFLEAFDDNTTIQIIDSLDGEIYHGRVGDVVQRILNMRNIIMGTTCIVEGNIRIHTERIEP